MVKGLLAEVLAGAVAAIAPVRCAVCERGSAILCSKCTPPFIAWGGNKMSTYLWRYTREVAKIITTAKYTPDPTLCAELGRILGTHVKINYPTWPIDLVIPVPSSNSRLTERGLSHTGIISLSVARTLQLPTSFHKLRYAGTGIPQVGLTNSARSENVKCGFKTAPSGVKGLSILLIDDVVTTGATIEAAKHGLYAGGAQTVFVATLASVEDKSMTNDQMV